MIRTRLLTSFFISTIVYCLISFFAGQNGLSVYNQLKDQKIEIAKQTNEIEKINTQLSLEYTALQKDFDIISAYARKLDYVKNGEKLIKINGLKPYQQNLYDVGTPLKHVECKYFPETLCKIITLFVFMAALILQLLVDISNGKIIIRKKRQEIVRGIPIYDFKQI